MTFDIFFITHSLISLSTFTFISGEATVIIIFGKDNKAFLPLFETPLESSVWAMAAAERSLKLESKCSPVIPAENLSESAMTS